MGELVAGLDKIDYVVETSNRLYDSIPRIPARYPSTMLYYKYLFDGTLGFEKVAEFHNYPQPVRHRHPRPVGRKRRSPSTTTRR